MLEQKLQIDKRKSCGEWLGTGIWKDQNEWGHFAIWWRLRTHAAGDIHIWTFWDAACCLSIWWHHSQLGTQLLHWYFPHCQVTVTNHYGIHNSIPVTYFTDKYATTGMNYEYFLELIASYMLSGSQIQHSDTHNTW